MRFLATPKTYSAVSTNSIGGGRCPARTTYGVAIGEPDLCSVVARSIRAAVPAVESIEITHRTGRLRR